MLAQFNLWMAEHEPDAAGQYLAVRHGERLADRGRRTTVASTGRGGCVNPAPRASTEPRAIQMLERRGRPSGIRTHAIAVSECTSKCHAAGASARRLGLVVLPSLRFIAW